MIHLKGITCAVPNTVLLKPLTLSLEPTISYLVTGPNGSGKTILLQLMAGKIQPRQGFIHFDFMDSHLDWDQRYALRKKFIHFIPSHALHDLINTPDFFYQQRYYSIESGSLLTVRKYLGDRLRHIDSLKIPASFQLSNLLDIELPRLSNGQVKKVIILKHLLDHLPKVLLLDYPFEGLDAASRTALSEFLDHLARTHHIQLIIADHEHPQLPFSLTRTITLTPEGISVEVRNPKTGWESVGFANTPIQSLNQTEPIVEMINVKIEYDGKTILPPLNWKINRGERWALTGRNGSGKTTLFSMIYADHPRAYSEQVYLFGKRRGTGESIWDIKKRIGYLGPEQLHFLDYVTSGLTVKELLIRQPGHDRNTFEELITYFEVESILDRKLRQLSNGQLQLVLLLSLFLSKKELLLLDEPFQFLDPPRKYRVSKFLNSVLDVSTTLILITHYEGDVEQWTNQRLRLP